MSSTEPPTTRQVGTPSFMWRASKPGQRGKWPQQMKEGAPLAAGGLTQKQSHWHSRHDKWRDMDRRSKGKTDMPLDAVSKVRSTSGTHPRAPTPAAQIIQQLETVAAAAAGDVEARARTQWAIIILGAAIGSTPGWSVDHRPEAGGGLLPAGSTVVCSSPVFFWGFFWQVNQINCRHQQNAPPTAMHPRQAPCTNSPPFRDSESHRRCRSAQSTEHHVDVLFCPYENRLQSEAKGGLRQAPTWNDLASAGRPRTHCIAHTE
jgi:hypothetical protein